MYPSIDDNVPRDEKVILLARQVGQLIARGVPFKQARSTVLFHRYGGRFKDLCTEVCSSLGSRSKRQGRQLFLKGV